MAAHAIAMDTQGEGGTELDWLTPARVHPRAGVRLLEVDPDLGRSLDAMTHARLSSLLRVQVAAFEPGPWEPAGLPPEPDSFGLLLVDGLLLRDLSVQDRCCAELLGPGDLLRPWPTADEAGDPGAAGLQWNIVDGPARFAVLDRRASIILGRFPALVAELLDRSLARSRALQFQLELTQVHGIGQRLELLLWQLADRWGRVTLDGVVLPLELTHEMLGRLIGARRPSVTTALRELARSGAVERRADGWVLRADPRAACTVLPFV